jgi:hypothetical protein
LMPLLHTVAGKARIRHQCPHLDQRLSVRPEAFLVFRIG